MENVVQETRCKFCKESLPLSHFGACPKCGETGKLHKDTIQEYAHVQEKLFWKHTHVYLEKHKLLYPAVIFITLTSPFIGLFLAGWVGVIVGLIVSVASFLLSL